jgi:hypothetical protein
MKKRSKEKETTRGAPRDRERKPEPKNKVQKPAQEKTQKVWNPAALYF